MEEEKEERQESARSQFDQVKTGEIRKRLMLVCVCHLELLSGDVIGGDGDTNIVHSSMIDDCRQCSCSIESLYELLQDQQTG